MKTPPPAGQDTDVDTNLADEIAQLLFEGARTGTTLKELKGISEDMLESVYAYAHRFYSNGQLDQAETFFRFLCMYDFYNGEYALGLAAVHQMKKAYAKAIDLYALAYALLKDDERPMLHVGQCHLALGKVALARDCFRTVIARSTDESLLRRAGVYLQALDAGAPATPDTDSEPLKDCDRS